MTTMMAECNRHNQRLDDSEYQLLGGANCLHPLFVWLPGSIWLATSQYRMLD